jgi:GxxExxY protein
MQRQFSQKPKFEGKHADLSEKIISVFYRVYGELGFGFSEKVYQNAFAIALRYAGFEVAEQVPIKVHYRGEVIGEFFADMIINEVILLELKAVAVNDIILEHEAQLLNYLKATNLEVGYVLNFGPSAKFKRKVFDNDRKGSLCWTQK